MAEKFVENYLLFQLAFISHMFSAEFYEHLRMEGMRPARWRILVNLMDSDGMFVNDLVHKTLFEQSNVTKLTDQLCEEGLVEKRTCEADRRRVKVYITAKGRSIIAPLVDAAKKHEEKVLSSLEPTDRDRFKNTLKQFVEALI